MDVRRPRSGMMSNLDLNKIGVVVIGRNEELHLDRCLDSVPGGVSATVYVDSGSTDSSRDIANARGADVIELHAEKPFSAARGRNAGLARLLEIRPETQFVQFLDGDCALVPDWLELAREEIARDESTAVVCGRRRELYPKATLYNRLCDLEWDTPVGEADACGGDALMRCDALEVVGGFDDGLIAGEEPELCLRLRRAGYRIFRADVEMTTHDANMSRFVEWWMRAVRAGHALAEVSHMHPDPAWQIWKRELHSAWLWAVWVPLTIAAISAADPRALALLAVYPSQGLRIFLRSRRRGWGNADSALFSVACLLAKFAHVRGATRYRRAQKRGTKAPLIEYQQSPGLRTSSPRSPRRIRIVELVNQYPQPSHTFVRREIAGLESSGIEVLRVSVRQTDGRLADPLDRAELEKTRALLGGARTALPSALIRTLISHPVGFVRATAASLHRWRRSDRSLIVHAAYLAEACLLFNWCRADTVDWVHAHFGTNATCVAMLCRRLGGPPFSFTVHGPEEFDRPQALGVAHNLHEAAFTVAISDYGRSQLMRWSDRSDWSRIHVVRCGVDIASCSLDLEGPPDNDRLLCVARLAEQKGLFVLLDALAELTREGIGCQVRIIGDGPLRGPIERRAAELGIEANLTLLGWKDGATVVDELRSARGFVLPSFAEGLPVVLMEALAAGRPVVTTYVAGIPELVKHGRNGWLVPAGASSELARAMRCLLETSVEELAEMGRRGASRVAERHDAATSAGQLGKLILTSLECQPLKSGAPARSRAVVRLEHADA